MNGLEFERPIIELETRIQELREFSREREVDLSAEIDTLEKKLHQLKTEIYGNLTAWQRIQIARHPRRPYTLDYVRMFMEDFVELRGDRLFSEDRALVCGLAKIGEERIVLIGHQKGHDTKENIARNFGCAHPEGYRKAIRIMRLGEKFGFPVVVFIDTPGAYPGIGAEERGQAQAIAENIREMGNLKVPLICCVIGEGGSGGALGVGVGDAVLMMENAYYSVISPEGCAAILWKDSTKAQQAAEVLKLTAKDLLRFGIIDDVIPEPLGGAHRDPRQAGENLKRYILQYLKEIKEEPKEELLKKRYRKFRKIGVFA